MYHIVHLGYSIYSGMFLPYMVFLKLVPHQEGLYWVESDPLITSSCGYKQQEYDLKQSDTFLQIQKPRIMQMWKKTAYKIRKNYKTEAKTKLQWVHSRKG